MSGMSQPAIAGQVEIFYAPSLLGTFLAAILYGVSITQTYFYFKSAQGDRKWLKGVIITLVSIDTVVTALDIEFMYSNLILKFGSPTALLSLGWAFALNRALTGTVAMIVQFFYAWRVHILTKNRIIVGSILIFAVLGYGSSLALTSIIWNLPLVHYDKFKIEAYVWLLPTMICDSLITGTLVWYLRSRKSGFSSTDDFIDRIIRLTVQTGLFTTIFALMDLILYVTMGTKNGAHIAFQVMLSKLYVNSVLSSLNSRRRTPGSSKEDTEMTSTRQRLGRNGEVFTLNTVTRPRVMITVDRQHDTDADVKDVKLGDATEEPTVTDLEFAPQATVHEKEAAVLEEVGPVRPEW